MAFLLLFLAAALAFANGANDVSKGVATLVGGGLATERRALVWGAGWTLLGVVSGAGVSRGLLELFSWRGLVVAPPDTLAGPVAVAAGAIGWLGIATRTGLPVSTTHALVGGILGAGLVASGAEGVRWPMLARSVALPLLLSPILSLAIVWVALLPLGKLSRRLEGHCVCLAQVARVPAASGPHPVWPAQRSIQILAGPGCPPGVAARVRLLDAVHWLTAGFTCFARGANDAPKVLALGLAAGTALDTGPAALLALVAVAMGAGSYLAGRRVTGTLARGVTPMAGPEALAANATTSALVSLASVFALPVSTTHVSTGSVVAVALHRGRVPWRLVAEIFLAWLVTVPVAALLAGLSFAALR